MLTVQSTSTVTWLPVPGGQYWDTADITSNAISKPNLQTISTMDRDSRNRPEKGKQRASDDTNQPFEDIQHDSRPFGARVQASASALLSSVAPSAQSAADTARTAGSLATIGGGKPSSSALAFSSTAPSTAWTDTSLAGAPGPAGTGVGSASGGQALPSGFRSAPPKADEGEWEAFTQKQEQSEWQQWEGRMGHGYDVAHAHAGPDYAQAFEHENSTAFLDSSEFLIPDIDQTPSAEFMQQMQMQQMTDADKEAELEQAWQNNGTQSSGWKAEWERRWDPGSEKSEQKSEQSGESDESGEEEEQNTGLEQQHSHRHQPQPHQSPFCSFTTAEASSQDGSAVAALLGSPSFQPLTDPIAKYADQTHASLESEVYPSTPPPLDLDEMGPGVQLGPGMDAGLGLPTPPPSVPRTRTRTTSLPEAESTSTSASTDQKSQAPGQHRLHPLDLIPDIQSLLADPTASSVPTWAREWAALDAGYAARVWGFLKPYADAARMEIDDARNRGEDASAGANGGQAGPAVQRLEMVLGHVKSKL